MKLLSKFETLPRLKLVKIAIFLSIITILWSLAEGVISVFFGKENESVSLIFFGIDSLVEVTSSCVVLWRFLKKESSVQKGNSVNNLISIERKSTIIIGILFVILAIGTFTDAIITLAKNGRPNTSKSGLIISSVTICFMVILCVIKFSIAKQLNSSAMMSDAKCSLSCIQIAFVLFLGSLIYSVWSSVWWVDSAAALILGIFFAKEGIGMILWAMSKDFDGGCCKNNSIKNNNCDSDSNCQNDCNDKECKITVISENIVDKDNVKEEG
ncbi:14925_t:CDS:1 [Cetraspora pellucida]|uniref:14925_t:CDS:1 n=1 Tax=Cetraspora pellucida TaxID=1433469 RepID=A0ACA9P3D4_9GLOM|nr:14925_t:CDS:1 [Cetraspora pellucida]